jgi:CBS domain-containing protein
MHTVRQILEKKGRAIWSVSPDAMVYEALQIMAEKDVGALAVVDRGRLVGIMSERDYARKVFLKGKASPNTPVREIMTERVVTARLSQTVEECMALMTVHRTRHLPVMEGEELVGMISIGDVVKASLEDKDFLIQQLEHYIPGSP